jgi:hypothetical protein
LVGDHHFEWLETTDGKEFVDGVVPIAKERSLDEEKASGRMHVADDRQRQNTEKRAPKAANRVTRGQSSVVTVRFSMSVCETTLPMAMVVPRRSVRRDLPAARSTATMLGTCRQTHGDERIATNEPVIACEHDSYL